MILRRRLFVFLIVFVVVMTLGSIVILLILEAPLIDNSRELKLSVERELSVFGRDFEAHLGDVSLQLVRLSESLSKSIEATLNGNMQHYPDIPGKALENEFDRLMLAMDRTKSSGVFLILNDKENPGEQGGDFRNGVSFRVSGPDLLKADMPKRFLRGAPTSGFQSDFMMLSDWEPEFDVKDRSFYHLPVENGLPYWGIESIVSNQEPMILCSIPVIGTNGKVLGVSGFEISNVFFAARYPEAVIGDAGGYRQSFCLFSIINENGINIENALYAGGGLEGGKTLAVSEGSVLNTYTLANGKKLMGQHKNIKLYPDKSVNQSPGFVMAILIPKEEIDSRNFRIRLRLVLIIAALLGFGIFVSFFISKRYLRPVLSTIDRLVEMIREKDDINEIFTPEEIDVALLLIEGKMRSEISRSLHLSAAETDSRIESIRGKIDSKSESNPLILETAKEFKLTQRETDIFRCLQKGMTNSQISGELFISEGTVKIHVRNLLKKLQLKNRYGVTDWSISFSLQKGIIQ